jgi:hypothetical protein
VVWGLLGITRRPDPQADPERVARDLLALASTAPAPSALLAAAQELLERARAERDQGDGKIVKLGGQGTG